MNIDLGNIEEIEPVANLYMTTEDGKNVQIFTRDKRYKVQGSLRDLWVVDDTGTNNLVDGYYLTKNFRLHRLPKR